ncbi:MAG: signal peptidase II [Nitrospinae bacterium RIFCSPLOWO2_01_FULL_39_10]|nr:MAG: signal peptidase II [Nitrospinae bacterium RIFCSPLOWO2_01_FULL_39_10]
MNKKYFPLIIIFLIIVLIDQITKFYIASNFELYQSIEIIRGFFNITYIRNSGVAFGMFSNLKGSFIQIIFIAIYIIAIISILILYRETHGYSHIALSLIFSGAIGNLIDRIFRGEVVDFMDFHWQNYHWPAFNVADSCITVGVGLLMISIIISNEQRAMSNE